MGRWTRSVATSGCGRLKIMPISPLEEYFWKMLQRRKIDVVRLGSLGIGRRLLLSIRFNSKDRLF